MKREPSMHAPTMSQHNQQSSPVPEEPRTAYRAPRWARRTAAFMAAVFWLTQLQLVMVGTAQAQPQPPAGAIAGPFGGPIADPRAPIDRKSTRLNSSHLVISYAVFC